MRTVTVGVIGLGNIGAQHLNMLSGGRVAGAVLTAVCDTADRVASLKDLPSDCKRFTDAAELIKSGACDAVVIATPHSSHPGLAVSAFRSGLHVFCEKPAGVTTKEARRMNEEAARSGKIFTMNFNRRTDPVYRRIAGMIASGEIGAVSRVEWTQTNWFRTDAYFRSAPWRGTWKGEGGGVLLNQAPHVLDLWQWFFGLPSRVRAFCRFGKNHRIEVEDEVTAFLEYRNAATGTFITATGEAPGTNRLEIVADRGRLVMDDRKVSFDRVDGSVSEFLRNSEDGFAEPVSKREEIPVSGEADLLTGILGNFISVIREGGDLLVPGAEGIRSLELANAMVLSAWLDDWVSLPIDEDRYERELKSRFDSRSAAT